MWGVEEQAFLYKIVLPNKCRKIIELENSYFSNYQCNYWFWQILMDTKPLGKKSFWNIYLHSFKVSSTYLKNYKKETVSL